MKIISNLQKILNQTPSSVYLVIAVLIFSSSNSLTRRIFEIGKSNLINGRNPISLCNVLFIGNICALGLMLPIFYKDWNLHKLTALTRKDWINLTTIGILSGAIAPALIFTALGQTNIANIVLIGRIEPIITIVLSFFLLQSRFNYWTVLGSLASFAGAVTTAFLTSSSQKMMMWGFQLGIGEILVAIAAVIVSISTVANKLQLRSIPIGIITIYRNVLGTLIFFILANVLYGAKHFTDVLSPLLWQWMLIYAAVIVVVGQLCWLTGLKKATSTELNLASLFNPFIAIFMAYLILGEVPTSAQYWGGSLLLIGIVLSFIGNLYQSKSNHKLFKPILYEKMETNVGFRGI